VTTLKNLKETSFQITKLFGAFRAQLQNSLIIIIIIIYDLIALKSIIELLLKHIICCVAADCL